MYLRLSKNSHDNSIASIIQELIIRSSPVLGDGGLQIKVDKTNTKNSATLTATTNIFESGFHSSK